MCQVNHDPVSSSAAAAAAPIAAVPAHLTIVPLSCTSIPRWPRLRAETPWQKYGTSRKGSYHCSAELKKNKVDGNEVQHLFMDSPSTTNLDHHRLSSHLRLQVLREAVRNKKQSSDGGRKHLDVRVRAPTECPYRSSRPALSFQNDGQRERPPPPLYIMAKSLPVRISPP